jgi:CMP-N,N'-diacetyllegionaminic acid synthase
MYKDKRVLALITARGASKRLPGKNIKLLLGKPLVAWTIEQALKSKFCDKVIVSTDSSAIAEISRQFKAEVPFMRPKELATDAASSLDVVFHSLEFLRLKEEEFDYLALLEPTSPLRKKGDIDRAISLLVDNPKADALISLGRVHLEHPMLVKRMENDFVKPYTNLPQIHQSQQADEAYFPYGVIYLSKVDSLYKNKTFYPERSIPMLIERWQNYEVDDAEDFLVIEKMMQEHMNEI